MSMNRRQFLKGTLAGLGAAVMASFMPLVPSPEVGSALLQVNPGNKLLALKKGDIFTIQGIYAVNPVTQKPTDCLHQQ